MRRFRIPEVAFGFLIATAIWAVVLLFVLDPTTYHQICEPDQYGHERCAAHNFLYVILWYGGYVINAATISAAATAAIAWFTLTLKRSTDNLWRTADDQIKLARDDFNATHRPWLPITHTTFSSGLNWAQGNAIVAISITCTNRGNSPARRVSLAARIFPFLVNDDIPNEIARLQAEHRSDVIRRDVIERTLFPGPGGLELPRGLIIPESTLAELKDRFGDTATEMVPVIIGSIEYYFSFGDPTPHYTPFVYHLWRTDALGEARNTIKLDGRNVERSELILVPLINAGDPT